MSTHKERDENLRWEAFDLLDEGWTSNEVAELLEIKHMTVCGWMSWRTKGHYEHEESGRRHRKGHALRLVK